MERTARDGQTDYTENDHVFNKGVNVEDYNYKDINLLVGRKVESKIVDELGVPVVRIEYWPMTHARPNYVKNNHVFKGVNVEDYNYKDLDLLVGITW